MIKHPGRWLIAFIVVLLIASWLVLRYVDPRVLWLFYVVSTIVGMLLIETRRGARPGVLSITTTLLAAFATGWILFVLDARWWIRYLVLAVLGAPLMSIANGRYRADIRRGQERRDERATRLAKAVLAGERVEAFALYLRPFASTDRLMAGALPADFEIEQIPTYLDLETLLARAFRSTTPVIALGKSGDTTEGAARVTVSDDDWQPTVEALARCAEFIAMVPLSRPGTMWELDWLKQMNLLNKVLFIMPETPHPTPSGVIHPEEPDDRVFDVGVRYFDPAAHMLDLTKEWLQAELAAMKIGLQLPSLAAVGALFTIDPATGKVKEILPLSISTLMRQKGYLRSSVARLNLSSTSRLTANSQTDLVKAVVWGGRTLEFALTRAGDGFAVWGEFDKAIELIQRAIEAGRPRSQFSTDYIQSLPSLMAERVKLNDVRGATRYAEFARRVMADSKLAALATNDMLSGIDSLSATLDPASHGAPPVNSLEGTVSDAKIAKESVGN